MLIAAFAQHYAAVILMIGLWVGIALGVRSLLRWLAAQNTDSLGF